MVSDDAGYQPRSLRLIRGAALTGTALVAGRRLLYAVRPDLLPSSAWPREWWRAGLLLDAGFALLLSSLLLGVPFCIYLFRLRRGLTTARDLLIDCAVAAGLSITTFLFL